MSAKKRAPPGFDIDPESGKYVPVPFDWRSLLDENARKKQPPAGSSSSKKKQGASLNPNVLSSKPSFVQVPGIDINPQTGKYVFTSYGMDDFLTFVGAPKHSASKTYSSSKKENETKQPSKYRKSINGARKELFKVEDSGSKRNERQSVTKTNARRSLLRSLSDKRIQKSTKLKVMPTIDEHKKPKIPVSNRNSNQEQSPQLLVNVEVDAQVIKTPDSQSSDMSSFLLMEEVFKTPKVQNESPMGTVRKLFNTKLTLNTHEKNLPSENLGTDQVGLIARLRQVVQLDQQLCQEIAEKQALHVQHLATIKALTDQLAPYDTTEKKIDEPENKENCIRRSRRLQPISSPIPTQPKDLRKSVLTNNILRSGSKIRDVSEQKALDMYNSTRKICSVLLTPSTKKKGNQTSTTDLRHCLSMKVQEQCRMLQDTPCKK